MKNFALHIGLGLLSGMLIFAACKKNVPDPEPAVNTTLRISLIHKTDALPLIFDSLCYQNLSGSAYSVSRLQYYISGIALLNNQGGTTSLNSIWYVDARKNKNEIFINQIPVGDYTGLRFFIGISPPQNISGSLTNTIENINMQWPEMMGGGYHFLKLEGLFIDSADIKQGFSMHLGTNDMHVQHKTLSVPFKITSNDTAAVNLQMNVNEWFQNPTTYDFNSHGNYTMGIPQLMTILKNNGSDVFTVQN